MTRKVETKPKRSKKADLSFLETNEGLVSEFEVSSGQPKDLLRILTPESAFVKPGPQKILKAKAGMILTPERTVHAHLDVVVCDFRRVLIEWRSFENGGGFVARHPINSALVAECVRENGRLVHSQRRTEVADTTEYSLMALDGTRYSLQLAGANTQVVDQWHRMMASATLPSGKPSPVFAQTYRLKSALQTRGDRSWYSWAVSHNGLLQDKDTFDKARTVWKSFQ